MRVTTKSKQNSLIALAASIGLGLTGAAFSATANAAEQDKSMIACTPQACALTPSLDATTLSLSAQGEIKATPDMATINFGVMTEGKTAALALAKNTKRMNEVFVALKAMGITDRQMMTSGLNLNPIYEYPNNQAPVLKAYQANNRVTIQVEDLSKLGAIVDAVVTAGINQVDGINFGLKNARAAEDAARIAATKTILERAQLYANTLGLKVKRIIQLSEGGGYQPQPVAYPVARMAMAEAAPTPVAPGEMNVAMSVNALIELGK